MHIEPDIKAFELVRQLVHAQINQCEHILEIGSGSGLLLRELASELHATGCGIDPFSSEHTEGTVRFRPLKAEQLELLTRRFDIVYSVHSLHHFDEVDRALEGIQDVLGWSGCFIMVDWKKGAETGIAERYFSLEEIVQKVKSFNFRIIDHGETSDHFYLAVTLAVKKLAVSTEDGKTIYPKMFGQAPFFDIYKMDNGGNRFMERRKNIYQETLQHLKTLDVYKEVDDCQALLSRGIGQKGQARLKDKGVRLFFDKEEILPVLNKIRAESL